MCDVVHGICHDCMGYRSKTCAKRTALVYPQRLNARATPSGLLSPPSKECPSTIGAARSRSEDTVVDGVAELDATALVVGGSDNGLDGARDTYHTMVYGCDEFTPDVADVRVVGRAAL